MPIALLLRSFDEKLRLVAIAIKPPKYATTLEDLEYLKRRHVEENKYDFTSVLEIIVPSMDDYAISIVQIDYPKKMYPLRIMNTVTDSYRYKKCENEAQLNEELAKILSSAEVRRIIAGLLTEIRLDGEQIKD